MNEERMNKGAGRDRKGVPSEAISGPVPQKHRLRLGEADGEHNPYGDGEPSTKSTIANGGRNGW